MKNGWAKVCLDELTEDDSPITYGVVKPGSSGEVLFIRGGDVAEGRVLNSQLRTITDDVSKQYKRTLLRGGELLISLVGQPGQVAVVPSTLAGANIARQVGLIRLRNKVDADFICYFLRSPDGKAGLGTFTGGSVQQVINLGDLKKVRVPVPPLPEQRRIVGILDVAFAGIATAKANAEKNRQNARALFESHLQAVFTQRGEEWVEKRLGDIADFKNGLNYNQSSKGQSVRLVGVGDFGRNYIVPLEDLQSITIDDELDESYEIREHDLLTVRSNGSKDLVGRCMLVPAIDEVISYSGFVIRIRPNFGVVVSRLLLHFMKCSATRKRLTRDGGGANISNINQGKLSALTVSLPPLKRQQRIVDKLDRLMEETQRLESIYQQKLAALDELKKSLLHQAFNGQL